MADAELIQAIESSDGHTFDPASIHDRASLFLLSALKFETVNSDKLANLADLPRGEARSFGHNARRSGIFKGRNICADWFDEKEGTMAFILDTLCVAGHLERSQ